MTIKWWQVILLTFLAIDLALLNFKVFQNLNQNNLSTAVSVDQCGSECQKYIDSKVDNAISKIPTISNFTPTSSPISIQEQTVIRPKVRNISYLPIPTSGSTASNDWTSLSGTDFYFDTSDYPGLVEIYFEANIRLFNGNGIVFARLYDETHGVGVQGSEIQSKLQKDTAVVSGKVIFYQGKNLIKVQAKSLTADTAMFTSGRLKIITQN